MFPSMVCILSAMVLCFASPVAAQSSQPTRKAGMEPPLMVYNPANHHYYQTIAVPGNLTWKEALDAAAQRSFLGVKGHLATAPTEAVYNFLLAHLDMPEFWVGGSQDRNAADYEGPSHGWRWITGEPWSYTHWGQDHSDKPDEVGHVLSFWNAEHNLADHKPDTKLGGYYVEYPTAGPDPNHPPQTTSQEIEQFLGHAMRRYRTLRSYMATVEFTFKAHIETVDTVRAQIVIQPPGRFRLEGRGANGKVLAISNGQQLLLATTAPGETMRYLVKPLPAIGQALKEAFSLLTSSPKPPSLTALILGAANTRIWSGAGLISEMVDSNTPEQAVASLVTVRFPGEDPVNGNTLLFLSLNDMTPRKSEVNFRFKAYPYTVRETHSDVQINVPISPDVFAFTPPPGAEEVNDLGEGDDVDIEIGIPASKDRR